MSESRQTLFAFARNTLLRAGAGTGKTEALTTLYLHLVGGLAAPDVWPKQGVAPERIVALTFTEKAATEMRERIAEAVGLLAFEPLPASLEAGNEQTRAQAAQQWGRERGLSPAVVARVRALADSAAAQGRALPTPTTWQRVGFALGGARVGTFHGFAAGVLRAAALDLGIDPAFRVIEQETADRLLRDATVSALSSAARRDVSAVADLMATAGGIDPDAERGLVPLLADLVRSLDEAGAPDDSVGARPATSAAGPHVFIAVDALRTFASACETVPALANDGSAANVARLADAIAALGTIDDADRARRCADVLTAHPLPGRHRTKSIEVEAAEARFAVESLHDASLAILSERLAVHARAIVLDARRRFRDLKRQRAALDFADLMRGLRDALRDHPALRRAWKRRFDAVLVDEFQDTNRVQRDLLYLLRERRDGERTLDAYRSLDAYHLEPSGLLLVGDAKQSIYAFRGADVSVFFDTERDLALAGGARLDLTESHRSLDEVIAAVNPATEALLGAGLTAHAESMYDRERDALSAEARANGDPRVELMFVPGGTADTVRQAEAEAIARRIQTLVGAEPPFPPGFRAARYDEIAILVPSWSHLEPIRSALKERGVPYALLGGPGFWERREVDDLVTLLRFVADPGDRLALAAVLRGPLVGLSDAALAHLFARPATLDDLLDPIAAVRTVLDPDDRARLDEARPTLRRLLRFGATLGPEAALRLALTERGSMAVLATLPFGAQKVANVDKLVGIAAMAERRGGEESDVAGFVRYVDRMRAAGQHETEADVADVATGAVQILSVHAAKGLEWPVVFLAQTSRRRRTHAERVLLDAERRVIALPAGFEAPQGFRDLRRDVHAAEDDDQRRLLYVGLTRARDLVVASGPMDEGDGEWVTLNRALLHQAPARVRVLNASLDGPAVPVRATAALEHDAAARTEALARAIDPPPMPRRRLAVVPAALEEFARCPRRHHSLFELRLDEFPRALTGTIPQPASVLTALRALLAQLDLTTLAREPVATLAAAAATLDAHPDLSALTAARPLARRVIDSPLGAALVHPDAVIARDLPLALRVGEGDDAVDLHDRADLVLRGEPFGRDGLIVLAYALGPAGTTDPARHALTLGAWTLALTKRLALAEPVVPPVHAAVAHLSSDAVDVEFLDTDTLALASLEPRLVALGHALARARADVHWEGRPRLACEQMRCGFLARCHAT